MRKRIELIFDNSYSMSGLIGRKSKLEEAKEIFCKEILPKLENEKEVHLRVISSSCDSKSSAVVLSNNSLAAKNQIERIRLGGNTPLYRTIIDAIEESKDSYDQLDLIILSDGGDNCSNFSIGDIAATLDNSNLKNSMIIKFGEFSGLDNNSIDVLSSRLKGTVIKIGGNGKIDKRKLKRNISNGLKSAGILIGKLPQHFDKKLKGADLDWVEAEKQQCSKFYANILFEKGLLSFDPYKTSKLKPYMIKELEFLCSIFFSSCFDIDQNKYILHNLEKPYFYNHEDIFWDFKASKWVEFKHFELEEVVISDFDDDAIKDEAKKIELMERIELLNSDDDFDEEIEDELQNFNDRNFYQVVIEREKSERLTNPNLKFNIIPYNRDARQEPIHLRDGDLLKFIR